MKPYSAVLFALALFLTTAVACSGQDGGGDEALETHCIYQIRIFEMESRAFSEDERATVVANVTRMEGEVLSSSEEWIKARARCGLDAFDLSDGVFSLIMSSSEAP